MTLVHGAGRDLERTIKTHLFVICPNNSGSTFLKEVLATCRSTWNLEREGQAMLGYPGPVPDHRVALIWASTHALRQRFTDTNAYDWSRARRAWYFQAYARDPEASVFVTKSPPHLLLVGELARHFANPKFLFMVRNPYAVCQGICRYMRRRVRLPEWKLGGEGGATHRRLPGISAPQRRSVPVQRPVLHLRDNVRRARVGSATDRDVGSGSSTTWSCGSAYRSRVSMTKCSPT